MNKFQVVIVWERALFLHNCGTWADALDWAKQYPLKKVVVRIWRGNNCIAKRG